MNRKNAKESILAHLKEHGSVQNLEIARATGLTRQAVFFHFSRMVREGILVAEGQGRSTRYRKAPQPGTCFRYTRDGLEEDRVWKELQGKKAGLADLAPNDKVVFQYAFLELLNNAIDHSQGKEIEIEWETTSSRMAFEVRDDGIGVFAHIQQAHGLAGLEEAVQELSKGKLTTQPERHSGEGIFFVSKAADRFELESDGLVWVVDNQLRDTTMLAMSARRGTRVRFERAPGRSDTLEELFAQYTHDHQFSRTRTVVKLFERAEHFLSRSEARRLMLHLEKFDQVVLDFAGVKAVGQGFVDEVFRVWQRAHPEVVLEPVNMSSPVAFMVKRGLGRVRP